MSVRSLERPAHRRFDIDRLGAKFRTVRRVDLHVPVRILRAGDDQPLERQFRRPHRALGGDEVLLLGRGLRLRLNDVDRRHRADLDAGLVVLHELVREIDRLLATSTDCTAKT